MLFQEPRVEYVELMSTEITTKTGPGYTVCQRVFTSDVGCQVWGGNVSAAELCEESNCDTSSNAANYTQYNAW